MEKNAKIKKGEEQSDKFHYRARSFRLSEETYAGFMESFKASGKRSWNLFFADINKKILKKK